MQAVMERQAGSGDMCLSCHDGSVVDSRFKVWSTRHHTTDAVPSPAVTIPTETFPLDDQGRMTCATCHTAHAVAGNSDLRTVIFLRQPNIDSSLCLACHPQHAQKSDRQHPLGRRDSPVPKVILDAGGKTSPDGHMVFCQTCHEPHGARNAWMLVLPPSELCIACHTDKAPEVSPPAGAPVHRIGHTYTGFKPPASLLEEKATFGPNGELGCLSCHRLHDASGAKPLLIRKNENSTLCLECHETEKAILGSPHDLDSAEEPPKTGKTPSFSRPKMRAKWSKMVLFQRNRSSHKLPRDAQRSRREALRVWAVRRLPSYSRLGAQRSGDRPAPQFRVHGMPQTRRAGIAQPALRGRTPSRGPSPGFGCQI
jgi:predicted CXXCH cytochrome family protein